MRKLNGITTDTPLTLEDVAAVPAPVARAGGAKRGTDNPAEDFRNERGFGPPGFDRPPLGYIPPDQRPVRLRPPVGSRERDVLDLILPVRAIEVPAYEAKGWERV
jgi:hypothetical protein